jgi:hypothetical protein
MSNNYPVRSLERWQKSVEIAAKYIEKLDNVSDVKVVINPSDPFPVAGMNPNIRIHGEQIPNDMIVTEITGGLKNRETTGYAIIELILHQPGFVHHGKTDTSQSKIAPKFKLHIHLPRDYPCHLGYGVLFVESGGFQIPSYPNIMKRDPTAHYLDNLSLYGSSAMGKAYPTGCMCHNSLSSPQSKPVQAVVTIANYLKVNPKDFDKPPGSSNHGRGNDGGFDAPLYAWYHENHRAFANLIKSYRPKPDPIPGPAKRPPPPPPPKKRQPRSPPPPPPPPRRR